MKLYKNIAIALVLSSLFIRVNAQSGQIYDDHVPGKVHLWTTGVFTGSALFKETDVVTLAGVGAGNEQCIVHTSEGNVLQVYSEVEVDLSPGTDIAPTGNGAVILAVGTPKKICFSNRGVQNSTFTVNTGYADFGPYSSMFIEPQCFLSDEISTNEAELKINILDDDERDELEIVIHSDVTDNISITVENLPLSTNLYDVVDGTVYFKGEKQVSTDYSFYFEESEFPLIPNSNETYRIGLKHNGTRVPITSDMAATLSIADEAGNSYPTEVTEDGYLIWNCNNIEAGTYSYILVFGGETVMQGELIRL